MRSVIATLVAMTFTTPAAASANGSATLEVVYRPGATKPVGVGISVDIVAEAFPLYEWDWGTAPQLLIGGSMRVDYFPGGLAQLTLEPSIGSELGSLGCENFYPVWRADGRLGLVLATRGPPSLVVSASSHLQLVMAARIRASVAIPLARRPDPPAEFRYFATSFGVGAHVPMGCLAV